MSINEINVSTGEKINRDMTLDELSSDNATKALHEKTWVDNRKSSILDGGYGTIQEQLEIIGEQGVTAFKSHIAQVKTRFPKF